MLATQSLMSGDATPLPTVGTVSRRSVDFLLSIAAVRLTQ